MQGTICILITQLANVSAQDFCDEDDAYCRTHDIILSQVLCHKLPYESTRAQHYDLELLLSHLIGLNECDAHSRSIHNQAVSSNADSPPARAAVCAEDAIIAGMAGARISEASPASAGTGAGTDGRLQSPGWPVGLH